MEIIKAIRSDEEAIMSMFRETVKGMHSLGIFQWNDKYPNSEVVESDINEGTAYIIKCEGKCIASITLNEDQPPEYCEINWKDICGKPLVIHRLAVHPLYQNRGLAKQLMAFTEQIALKSGYTSIRIDTYSENPIAIGLYESQSYVKLGQVFFPFREVPFVCMEKIL